MLKSNMETLRAISVLFFYVITITGCTVVGNKLGKSFDSGDSTRHEDKYTKKGASVDAAIIEAIFFSDDAGHEHEADTGVCSEPGTRQICTAKKGCWCEKNNREGLMGSSRERESTL